MKTRIALVATVALAFAASPALAGKKKSQGGQNNSTKVGVSVNNTAIGTGGSAFNYNLGINKNSGNNKKGGWSW